MEKSLFEQIGGTYTQQGDYLLPNLILAEEQNPIGIWGQRHARYLKQHHRILYYNLLTSGKLNAHLAEIDRQAHERLERLIGGMKQAQDTTEQLKAENALECVGRMNKIRTCAMEIVNEEIIFVETTLRQRIKTLPLFFSGSLMFKTWGLKTIYL